MIALSYTTSNLQPSDLRSNAYRSLPGDKDVVLDILVNATISL